MIDRRALLFGACTLPLTPHIVGAAEKSLSHGYSVLGALKYAPTFGSFDYVNPDAPKGGVLRLMRIGAFGTSDTLRYPGRPAADLRLVYDRLLVQSDDEIASYYALLADGFAVSDDFTAIEFSIDAEARWQDGRPVRADDVAFTLETLRRDGAPFYRQAFQPLTAEVLSPQRLVVCNARVGDRDVLRKLSTIPIHPQHLWRDGAAEAVVGSGPFRLERLDPPRRLTLARDPNYWAAGKAVNKGRWNFDRLEIDYYRDAHVAFEAFKAGEFDVHTETNPTRWFNSYDGPPFDRGDIVRISTDGLGVGELMGLVFNLRRPPLDDRRVREALVMTYDFERLNENLFSGAFAPFDSVFAGTPLEAVGKAGAGEREILARTGIADEALVEPDPLARLRSMSERERLRRADSLLREAGLRIVDEMRRDRAGEPMRLEVLVTALRAERVVVALQAPLRRLGIELAIQRGDPASMSRRMLDRDFDLATLSWSPARLPGTAERLLWHSALADDTGSYALSGLKSEAVDTAIEALEVARSEDALVAAGRAFDRAFRHELAILPLWRGGTVRLAWWDRFARPDAERRGFPPSPEDRWWSKA